MYLDALAGFYVRAGFRRWFFVVGDDDESEAQVARVLYSLRERHFGAREVGRSVVSGTDFNDALSAIERADAEVVLLLAPTDLQLELLTAMEQRGLEVEVTGYPYQDAQTRAFFAASADAAPTLGTGRRATAWEPTLDAYGARELNARYQDRFGEPMESAAWAAFQAAKMVFEASALGGATDSNSIAEYFRNEQNVFDLWKGIGVTFRPWNQQLRQPLYLVKIVADADSLREQALLVGELPAIYMPQTDPVERLDQLGDLRNRTECDL
jgi:ABC transporter substrate binding protein (PQQ-dependent alcohol dehydrogenase system)